MLLTGHVLINPAPPCKRWRSLLDEGDGRKTGGWPSAWARDGLDIAGVLCHANRDMNPSPKSYTRLRRLLAAVLFVALFACGTAHAVEESLEKVLASLNRSVVRIFCLSEDGHSASMGTGFFVGDNGCIITNCHVVAEGIAVVFVLRPDMKEADMYYLSPVRVSPDDDLALMRPEGAKGLPPPLPLKKQPAKVLDRVVAAGFPGLIDHYDSRGQRRNNFLQALLTDIDNLIPNITQGAVSKVSPSRITHNATIGRGNSGGPLVDMETGEVVGVNTSLASDQLSTFFFAIPVDKVRDLLAGRIGMEVEQAPSCLEDNGSRVDPALLSDSAMGKLIALHFFNGFENEAFEEAYAPFVQIREEGKSMTRRQYIEGLAQYRRRWPLRHYEILGVARRGGEAEIVFRYVCIAPNGKQAKGYSRLQLEFNSFLQVVSLGETTSAEMPEAFSPGFREMEYGGPEVFSNMGRQERTGVSPDKAVRIASRRLECNQTGNLDAMAELYALRIHYENEGGAMGRQEFLNDFKKYMAKWPQRRYKLLAVGFKGNEVEMVISFECRSSNGKVSRGYSKTRLSVDGDGLIDGMSEQVSRRSAPALSPGFVSVPFRHIDD